MLHAPPADATTLIYLAKADAFAALAPVIGRLRVPPWVWHEAVEEGERIGAAEVPRIHRAEQQGLVERCPLSPSEQAAADGFRRQGLGRGESEVLAMGGGVRAVLVDEGRASRMARAHGMAAHSTLELVIRAERDGQVDRQQARALARRLAVVMNVTADVLATIERMLES